MKQERVWLAEVLDLALDLGIVVPADLLQHISTTELARQLPRDELARLLAAGLSEATFAPDTVVSTLGVMVLVEHLSTAEIWAAIQDGMERGLGLAEDESEKTRVHTVMPLAASPPAERPPAPPPAAAAPKPAAPSPPRAAPPKSRATLRGQIVSAQVVQTTPKRPDATEQSPVAPPPTVATVEATADLDEVLLSLEEDDKKK
jgi:hypothetical protein